MPLAARGQTTNIIGTIGLGIFHLILSFRYCYGNHSPCLFMIRNGNGALMRLDYL
ncbi:uncharacterized protein METZ01_LOCUS99748, partial [marine metagenome]